MSAEAYGRRNLSLSVGRSLVVWVVAAVPVSAALEMASGYGRWGPLGLLVAYALGVCLGVDTGTRSVAGGLSAIRRGTVWLLVRGDARGLVALMLFGLGAWFVFEAMKSMIGLAALMETWPQIMEGLADRAALEEALERLKTDISDVGATARGLGVVVASIGLLGIFWSGALDGMWLGSAASRTGVSWWRLLTGLRGWRDWTRSREERRRAYWGAVG